MAETKTTHCGDDVRQRLAAQRPSETHGPTEKSDETDNPEHAGIFGLHDKVGNRGVRELIGKACAEPGRVIEESARAPFEASFGRSFADVELHEGPTVDAVTRAMGASAFAAGDHIYVHSKVSAEMPAGREVLGEELAHVAQGVGAAGADRLLDPEGAVEHEAHRAARAAAIGERADIGLRPDVAAAAGRFVDPFLEMQEAAQSAAQEQARRSTLEEESKEGQAFAAEIAKKGPSGEQIARLKLGALPPLNSVINKLSSNKNTVVPPSVLKAAEGLADPIFANGNWSNPGPVDTAAFAVVRATTTLKGAANPKKQIVETAKQVMKIANDFSPAVQWQRAPAKEGDTRVRNLTPTQAEWFFVGLVTPLQKAALMLGRDEPDLDLIDGLLAGAAGTARSPGLPVTGYVADNIETLRHKVMSLKLGVPDAIQKAILLYTEAKNIIEGLADPSTPPPVRPD